MESGNDKTIDEMFARRAQQLYPPELTLFDGSLRGQILNRVNADVVSTWDIKVMAHGGCLFVAKHVIPARTAYRLAPYPG
jgi:hypothetical protein